MDATYKQQLTVAIDTAVLASLRVQGAYVEVAHPMFAGYDLKTMRRPAFGPRPAVTYVCVRHRATGDHVWSTPDFYLCLAIDLALQEGKLPAPWPKQKPPVPVFFPKSSASLSSHGG